jgi:hypothetical protein
MTDDTDDTDDGRIAQIKDAVTAIVNSPDVAGATLDLGQIPSVSEQHAEILREAGFETVGDVADADQDRLTMVDGIGDTRAASLQRAAQRTQEMSTAAGDGDPTSSEDTAPTAVSDETVAAVAAAADVSEAEARAVIEHAAQTGEVSVPENDQPPAVEDPALREYAADLIAPASLKLSPTNAQTSDVYTKTIYVEGYPEYARPKMVERLFADADHVDVDVSIHVGSHDRLDAIGHLRSAIEDLEVIVAQKDDSSDVTVRDSVRRLDAHEDVYDHLSTGQDEAFDVGFYIILRAADPDRLAEAADSIETKLKTRQLTVKPADYKQQDGLVAGSPLAIDQLERTKTMLGGAVGTMFPFSSTSLIEPSGVFMGYHALTDSPIMMDRYARANYNVVVAGELGAGKSFDTKLNLLRRVARDPETIVIIIDPRGGFHDLVETLDGNRIAVGGDCPINPLELKAMPEHVRAEMDAEYDPFKQARESAMDTFDSYFAMNGANGDTDYTERRAILGFALDITYALCGITADPATHTNPSPVIPDVRAVLGAMNRNPEPFIRLSNTGLRITPDIVDDLPGLDVEHRQVTATSAPERTSVAVLPAIDTPEAECLASAGLDTVGALVEADPSTIARAADVRPSDADEWREQAVSPAAYTSAPAAQPTDTTDTTAADGGVDAVAVPDGSQEFEIPDEEITNWSNHATGLKIALQPFRPGGPLGHLGQPTEIDISDSNVVYLDFEASDTETEMSLMTKVLFNAVYERAKTTDKRVMLPIDEAWRLIKNSESLTWLEQGTRFSRHHDLSIQFITQTLDEFYAREDAKAIIDNCATKLLHRLDGLTTEQADYLGLTDREVNYINSATSGETGAGYSQALLMVEDKGKYPLRVEALPEEVPVIDPDAAGDMDLAHGGDA